MGEDLAGMADASKIPWGLGRRQPNIDLGPLGAIVWVSRPLRCVASLVSLARTRETGGERRGARAPAFRLCTGSDPERKPRSDAKGPVLHGLGHHRPVTLDRYPAGPVAAVALHL